ncbi:MAG: hypothetical protein EPO68_14930, partial [Planctomycetota bacterium]
SMRPSSAASRSNCSSGIAGAATTTRVNEGPSMRRSATRCSQNALSASMVDGPERWNRTGTTIKYSMTRPPSRAPSSAHAAERDRPRRDSGVRGSFATRSSHFKEPHARATRASARVRANPYSPRPNYREPWIVARGAQVRLGRVDSARENTAGERALESTRAASERASERLRCWLLGSEALLAECGEILLRGGHEIHGVVTCAPLLAEWARSRGLEVLDSNSPYAERLAERPFDHLFAITHLALLPESILRLPLRGAINFHDGPLPDYAGLHAPAWAIWNGETSYGVAWHLMTPAIDAGPVLEHAHFEIAPDETAYSLNAKCFEAAIESFEELVPKLAARTSRALAQDLGKRRYFERHRRPPAAGAIDWTRTARQIAASVRAVDFGRHANPLGLVTLERAGQLVVVRRARELAPHEALRCAQQCAPWSDAQSAARAPASAAPEPGTVLECNAEAVAVACAGGAIALDGFTDARGRPLSAAQVARRLGLGPGIAFTPLPRGMAERLGALDRNRSRWEQHWVRALHELDPIELPLALPARAPNAAPRPADALVAVPAALAQRFPGHAGAELVLAAWCGFLARLARRDSFDIAFTDAELRRECDGLEAWVCGRLPLRVAVDVERDFAALLEHVLGGLAQLRRRGPWLHTLVARAPALDALRRPDEDEALSVGFEALAEFGEPTLPHGVDWTLEVRAPPGQPIECRCVYDRLRIGAAQARSIHTGFAALLHGVASRPELPLGAHPLVSPDERERQLVDWNRTDLPLRRDACVHELFEEQAHRTPAATALVCDDTALDYAELDRRAELLARELVELGVRAGALVGVCVERSVEMVVAVLGVLKAGGAYLPLDPALPAERIAFMIADARLEVVVTSERLARALPLATAHTLRIDADWPRIAARGVDATPSGAARAASHDLAYAIYTSGTTGRPKGVLVEHRNVASFCAAIDRRIPHEPPGTWLALTSLSFDISVLELLWALSRGFKVILHTGRERARASA